MNSTVLRKRFNRHWLYRTFDSVELYSINGERMDRLVRTCKRLKGMGYFLTPALVAHYNVLWK